MKKISKFIKKNIKIVIAFSIGFILAGTSVYAANTVNSKNVTYDNSGSGLSSVNVQDALDELYLKMYPSQFYKKLYESAVRDDRSSTYVSSSDGIDFSEISSNTNGKGLYIASEYSYYKYPILYYRGDVSNNNLIFAGFCWKIVRTTETGGIKLIYNGVPSNSGTCDNTGSNSQIVNKEFNTNYNSLAYVGYMYGTPYAINSKNISGITNTYYYGNDITYSNGKYTLTDTISSSSWPSIYNGGLNNNHYTCLGGTTCGTVYYIYYTNNSTMYYITLTGGKTVEDALTDMLDNNITSSTIKGNNSTSGTLDNWYYTNIEQKGYSDQVEDTIWCNDRSISELNGWNPDGGNTRSYLYFEAYKRAYTTYIPDLSCTRDIDRFTVNTDNGNGELDYQVGLLTVDEIMLAGGNKNTENRTYYLYTGQHWWLGSSIYLYDNIAIGAGVSGAGLLFVGDHVYSTYGVRPSISLKPGTESTGGDGSAENPYIVS